MAPIKCVHHITRGTNHISHIEIEIESTYQSMIAGLLGLFKGCWSVHDGIEMDVRAGGVLDGFLQCL